MYYDEEFKLESSGLTHRSYTEQGVRLLELVAIELKNIANELHKINELQEKE